ncbi:hypothetical protein MalM25_16060 [Planctomycetes bacterium MalM25]|nr:hypothetical protein MalM25_16060 [Planctomycetes bacterium MalM25]
MADFRIVELEGTRYVDVHLDHELVRVESGALSYWRGDITAHSRFAPSIGGAIKSMLADESIYRPTYFGTGVLTLESSLGGFHVVELRGESWILERGSYWASEGDIDVGFRREPVQTSLWAGEGPVYLQTRVRGYGKVVLTTRGPIDEVQLAEGEKIAAEGKYVVARTADVRFSVKRTTKNFLGRFTSGEGLVRTYTGPGRVLINPAPYWRYRVFTERGDKPDLPSTTTT